MNQIIIVNNTLDINSLPELKPGEERRIIASKTATIKTQTLLTQVSQYLMISQQQVYYLLFMRHFR